jgi:hypothetical protein
LTPKRVRKRPIGQFDAPLAVDEQHAFSHAVKERLLASYELVLRLVLLAAKTFQLNPGTCLKVLKSRPPPQMNCNCDCQSKEGEDWPPHKN